jgi:DNA replication and repair protein RecF
VLKHITIEGVRNLAPAQVALPAGATALFGANGSGKTSFLEAIHLLAVGRSFRTHQSKPVIQHGRAYCRVVGEVRRGGRATMMGLEKHRDGSVKARVGGDNVASLSELALHLPLVLVDTEGLGIVTGPPEGRRRLLDGTLFHVEQGFLSQWKRYALAVRQRNSGLRRGILGSDGAWRQEIAETGTLLTQQRQALAEKFAHELARLAPALSDDLAGFEVVFRAGWDQKLSLFEALERNADSDTAQGFTQVGPHRADLRLMRDGSLAAEVLSRGQLKLALVALKLVQGVLIEDASSLPPLYLVDDLPAELDRGHCSRVCEQLGIGRQVILTAVDRAPLEAAWGEKPLSLFHVEHGQVLPA